MTEQRPAVEFNDEEDNDSSDSWLTLAGVALVFGAITIALAIPGVWDEHIAGYSGRRRRGFVGIIEAIGYWPIFLSLAAITVGTAIAAIKSFITHRSKDKD